MTDKIKVTQAQSREIDKLVLEIKELKNRTTGLENDFVKQKNLNQKQSESCEIKSVKTDLHKLESIELRNRTVQLFYALMTAIILKIMPQVEPLFADKFSIRFDEVLKNRLRGQDKIKK